MEFKVVIQELFDARTLTNKMVDYSADSGTYVALWDNMSSRAEDTTLNQMLFDHGFNPYHLNELHCTLIYSPDVSANYDQYYEIQRYLSTIGGDVLVQPVDVVVWNNSGKIYVVALLELHPTLIEANQFLRNGIGLVPTFDDYIPHVTIATTDEGNEAAAVDLAEAIKSIILSKPFNFKSFSIENISDK